MLGNEQKRVRNGNTTSRKGTRTFYCLLAGATLLTAGFAAAVVGYGGSLSSAHRSADQDKSPSLALAQVETPSANTAVTTLDVSVAAVALLPSRPQDGAQADIDLLAIERQKADEARQAAKAALAHKLARLKLARSLLAAQARSEAQAVALAEGTTETPAPTITVAALQAVGTTARANADVSAVQAAPVLASLGTSIPAKPGAILPPLPGAKPEPPRRSKPASSTPRNTGPENASPVLAYARPGNPEEDENGVFGGLGKLFSGSKGLPGPGSKIAVYDISAATVHMPDGTKLKAHSGIGHRMDNPKYAYVKNLGPTPPNIYRLRMRERRFHGVEAIRMLPQDRAAMKGRDGMLAHTPLLRNSKGSHGCVAFRDYNKFLKAFKAGKVKTMIVVPSMEKLPTYMAKLNRGAGA
eukprot:g1689.t1